MGEVASKLVCLYSKDLAETWQGQDEFSCTALHIVCGVGIFEAKGLLAYFGEVGGFGELWWLVSRVWLFIVVVFGNMKSARYYFVVEKSGCVEAKKYWMVRWYLYLKISNVARVSVVHDFPLRYRRCIAHCQIGVEAEYSV